jgi:hypothetical protein
VRILTSAGEIPCELGVELLLCDDLLPPEEPMRCPDDPEPSLIERIHAEVRVKRARQARAHACRAFIEHGDLGEILKAIRLYGEFTAGSALTARRMTLHMESEDKEIAMSAGETIRLSMRVDL